MIGVTVDRAEMQAAALRAGGSCAPDRSGFVPVSVGMLRSWHWGSRTVPDVLLLHGASDHGRMWDGGAAVLAANGMSVMAVDLRGHGDSTADPDVAGLAHECDVLDVLAGLPGPVGLIGHSMGGRLALTAAAVAPEAVRWLVTIDGLAAGSDVGDPARTIPQVLDRVRSLVSRVEPRRYLSRDRMVDSRSRVNPRIPAPWMRHLVEHGSVAGTGGYYWKSCRPRTLPAEPESIRVLFSRASCPVLAVLGAAPDRWSVASTPELFERVGWLPDARRVDIADAGHYPHLEHPERVWAAIVGFIGGQP